MQRQGRGPGTQCRRDGRCLCCGRLVTVFAATRQSRVRIHQTSRSGSGQSHSHGVHIEFPGPLTVTWNNSDSQIGQAYYSLMSVHGKGSISFMFPSARPFVCQLNEERALKSARMFRVTVRGQRRTSDRPLECSMAVSITYISQK